MRRLFDSSTHPPFPQDYYQSLLDKRLLSDIKRRNEAFNGLDGAAHENGGPVPKKRKAAKRVGSYREKSDREYFANMESEDLDNGELIFVDSLERDAINTTSVVSVSMQNMVMQLRKCCNHPYLLEYPLTPGVSLVPLNMESGCVWQGVEASAYTQRRLRFHLPYPPLASPRLTHLCFIVQTTHLLFAHCLPG